ncbi:MAG: DegV family protein [Candidatus Kariarchaeaceae archaeon]
MNIKLLADSGCDIPLDELKEKGIYLVPVKILFGLEDYKDKVEMSVEEFYEKLETTEVHPTTSQPSPQDFYEAYEEAKEDGVEILVGMVLSSQLSGTYQSAIIAQNLFESTYGTDGMKIKIFDSLNATVTLAACVYTFSDIINRGGTLEELDTVWEVLKERTKLAGALTTLEYLQRSGRVSKAKAIVGRILNLRPLVSIVDGLVKPIGTALGSDSALKKEIEFLKKHFNSEEELRAVYINGRIPKLEEKLKVMVNEEFNIKKEHGITVGPAIGVHVGPEAVGVALQPLYE